jgi:hypothetical protein
MTTPVTRAEFDAAVEEIALLTAQVNALIFPGNSYDLSAQVSEEARDRIAAARSTQDAQPAQRTPNALIEMSIRHHDSLMRTADKMEHSGHRDSAENMRRDANEWFSAIEAARSPLAPLFPQGAQALALEILEYEWSQPYRNAKVAAENMEHALRDAGLLVSSPALQASGGEK